MKKVSIFILFIILTASVVYGQTKSIKEEAINIVKEFEDNPNLKVRADDTGYGIIEVENNNFSWEVDKRLKIVTSFLDYQDNPDSGKALSKENCKKIAVEYLNSKGISLIPFTEDKNYHDESVKDMKDSINNGKDEYIPDKYDFYFRILPTDKDLPTTVHAFVDVNMYNGKVTSYSFSSNEVLDITQKPTLTNKEAEKIAENFLLDIIKATKSDAKISKINVCEGYSGGSVFSISSELILAKIVGTELTTKEKSPGCPPNYILSIDAYSGQVLDYQTCMCGGLPFDNEKNYKNFYNSHIKKPTKVNTIKYDSEKFLSQFNPTLEKINDILIETKNTQNPDYTILDKNKVAFEKADKSICYINSNNKKVILKNNSKYALVNNKTISMNANFKISGNDIYIPKEFANTIL